MKKQIGFLLVAIFLAISSGFAQNTLNEGFENAVFPPDGWKIYSATSVSWDRKTQSSAKHSGSAGARVNYGTGEDAWLITPKLLPTTNDSIVFWLRMEDPTEYSLQDIFTVEVSTTNQNVSSFSVLETIWNKGDVGYSITTSQFYRIAVSLENYAGQEIYLAFHKTGEGEGGYMSLDDITGPEFLIEEVTCEAIAVTDEQSWYDNFTTKPSENCWEVTGWNWSNSNKLNHGYGTYTCEAISPVLDLSELTNPTLSVSFKNPPYNNIGDHVEIYYRASETDDWTLLTAYTEPHDNIITVEMALPNTSSTYQIKLKGIGQGDNAGDGISITEVKVFKGLPCSKPFNIDITTTSDEATLTWSQVEENVYSWNIYYKSLSDDSYTGPVEVSEKTYTITGLDPLTSYQAYIEISCDGETITSDIVTFKTECGVLEITDSKSWTDNLAALPECWDGDATQGYDWKWSSSTGYFSHDYGNYNAYIISPVLNISQVTTPYLKFSYKNELDEQWANMAVDKLIVSYRASDDGDWTDILELDETTEDWETQMVALPDASQTYQIKFTGIGYDGATNMQGIDNIEVYNEENPPMCSNVSGLTITDVEAYDAKVSWNEAPGITQYIVNYRTIGEEESEWDSFTTNSTDIQLANYITLSSDTQYEIYISFICPDETEYTSKTKTFQTLITCPKPTDLTTIDLNSSSVTMSWTEAGSADTYTVAYKKVGDEDWIAKEDVVDTQYFIANLDAQTEYVFSVKAKCSTDDISSATTLNFKTTCVEISVSNTDYTEDFSVVAETPTCWTRVVDNVNGAKIYPQINNNGELYFFSYISQGTSEIIALPAFAEDLSTLMIQLTARNHNPNNDYSRFDIGIMTSTADSSTFRTIAELDPKDFADNTQVTVLFSSWKNLYNNPEELTSATIALRSRLITTNKNDRWYIDNVTVSKAPSCFAPNNLILTNISENGTMLTWSGAAESFEVVLTEKASETVTNIEVEEGQLAVALGDLVAGMGYTVYVKGTCEDGTTQNSDALSFFVPANAVTLPYFTDFNSAKSGYDFTFSSDNTQNEWIIGQATGTESDANQTGAMYISNDGGISNSYNSGKATMAYSVLKFTTGSQTDYEFALDWKAYGDKDYGDHYLGIRVIGENDNLPTNMKTETDMTVLAHGKDITSWVHVSKVISLTPETNYKLVFFWINDSYKGIPINLPAAVDNISIVGVDCPVPNGLTITETNENSVSLSWTAEEETDYIVYYKKSSELLEWDSVVVGNVSSYEVDNLAIATSYDFAIAVACEESISPKSSVQTTKTLCGVLSVANIPYTEDFESYAKEDKVDCWTILQASGKYPCVWTSGGTQLLRFYSSSGSDMMIAMPKTVEDVNTLRLQMDYKGLNDGTMQVGVITDLTDLATFTTFKTFAHNDAKETIIIDFDSLNNTLSTITEGYIAFIVSSSSAWTIDDIILMPKPSCHAPANLEVSDVTENSAKLSWTSESYSTYRITCTSVSDNTVITKENIAATEYELDGLDAGTYYNVYVQTECENGNYSEMTNIIKFRTDCGAITNYPYKDNFNNYASNDLGCWTIESTGDLSFNQKWTYDEAGFLHSKGGNFETRAISPIFDLSEMTNPYMSFNHRQFTMNNSGMADSIVVSYRTSAEGTWNDLKTYTGICATWKTDTLPLLNPSSTYQLQFTAYGIGNLGGGADIDDISIYNAEGEAPAPCSEPTNLTVASVDESSATISWSGDAASYDVKLEGGYVTEVFGNSYEFNGLVAGMTYKVYVRSNCEYLSSPFVTIEFTTNEVVLPCDTVTNLTVTAVTDSSATISWDGEAASYDLKLTEDGDTVNTTNNNYTFTNLEAATSYTVFVRANCGEQQSEFVSIDFTTDSVYTTPCVVDSVSAEVSICEGETYTLGTQELSEAGIYTEKFVKTDGCDSVVILTLTVNPTYLVNVEDSIAEGESYVFGTQTITKEGTYKETFTTINGCDSVVNLTISYKLSSLNDAENIFTVVTYPNPTTANATLSVKGLTMDAKVMVTDINGRVISEDVLRAGTETMEIKAENLTSGVYYIRVMSDEINRTQQLIKK